MQYLTFIGTSDYRDIPTFFEDETITSEQLEDFSGFKKVRFVQQPIFERFAREINTVKVFGTRDSIQKYFPSLQKLFLGKSVQAIEMDEKISSDEFVRLLLNEIKQDEPMIFDITHCFRHLPIKLLFALKYVEAVKNVKIEHLYYGKVLNMRQPDEYSVITDFIKDYEMQKVAEYFGQFDRTLIVNSQDWDSFISSDYKISRFIKSLQSFNTMVEFCELDNAVKATEEVVRWARSLEQSSDDYYMLLPLAQKIKEKLSAVTENKSETNRLISLIRVLLEHNHYQAAITFTDQLFKNELIYSVYPDRDVRKLQDDIGSCTRIYFKKRNLISNMDEDDFAYKMSQFLEYKLIPDDMRYLSSFEDICAEFFDYLHVDDLLNRSDAFYKQNQETIEHFHNKIRNSINHGHSISEKTRKNIRENIEKMLLVIQELADVSE